MNNMLSYIIRFLFKIKWWLIFGPLAVALIGIYFTRNMVRQYEVTSSIYTGVVSGVDIMSVNSEDSRVDQAIVNNSMDNLINILVSKTTLKNVSMRLFVQHMMYGDPEKDNNYITAANYRYTYSRTPQEVRDLIDKDSEERSLNNLYAYERSSPTNYVYGLFNWFDPFYSYSVLSNIKVNRVGNSDMIDLYYAHSDPGIAYNTLVLLEDEFVKQYKGVVFGKVNDIIEYFRNELEKARVKLVKSEDSLTQYNVAKKVINYDKQAEFVAALGRDYDLAYIQVDQRYTSAKKEVEMLDRYIDKSVKRMADNALFISKLNEIANLSGKMARINLLGLDSTAKTNNMELSKLQQEYSKAEKNFLDYSVHAEAGKYTREGIVGSDYIAQWLQAKIELAKAEAELKVIKETQKQLDARYEFFSPVGTTIKRQEREIDFNERTYLTILNSLNAALLRKKNLELNSASLKVLSPPIFPITSVPTKRRMIILLLFFGTAFFIAGYFLLVELLDRTLKNKFKAERLTGGKVVMAFPKLSKHKYKKYNEECREIAIRYLSNALLNYTVDHKREGEPTIINVLSVERKEGKIMLAEKLSRYWQGLGFKVQVMKWGEDYISETKEYLLAGSVGDIKKSLDNDIVLVLHPALRESPVPSAALKTANVNLLLMRANRVWSDADQMIYDNVLEKADGTPVVICLTEAQRDAVELFTGLLPPITPLRQYLYNLSVFGLTSKIGN